MRGLVIVLLAVIAIFSLSFIASGIYDDQIQKTQNIEIEEKQLEFSTFTAAVCENNDNAVHCKDEFFVNCNGTVSKAVDVAECEGIKVEVPKALGFATFGSEWKDPRDLKDGKDSN